MLQTPTISTAWDRVVDTQCADAVEVRFYDSLVLFLYRAIMMIVLQAATKLYAERMRSSLASASAKASAASASSGTSAAPASGAGSARSTGPSVFGALREARPGVYVHTYVWHG